MRAHLLHKGLLAALVVGAAANTLTTALASAAGCNPFGGPVRVEQLPDRGRNPQPARPTLETPVTMHGLGTQTFPSRNQTQTLERLGENQRQLSNAWNNAGEPDFGGRGVIAGNRVVQHYNDPNPIVHHARKQWLRTLHIRAKDGSNTLVNVHVTATPPITVSYDPASQTVSGYGGPGTVTVTGEVETVNGNVPFSMTITVS